MGGRGPRSRVEFDRITPDETREAGQGLDPGRGDWARWVDRHLLLVPRVLGGPRRDRQLHIVGVLDVLRLRGRFLYHTPTPSVRPESTSAARIPTGYRTHRDGDGEGPQVRPTPPTHIQVGLSPDP